MASVPLILVVPADGPKTTAELIDRMRREPDKYSYASSGIGGMIHLASYLFVSRAKAEALTSPLFKPAKTKMHIYVIGIEGTPLAVTQEDGAWPGSADIACAIAEEARLDREKAPVVVVPAAGDSLHADRVAFS